MADNRRKGLLPEDNSEIELVPDGVREMWSRDRPPLTEKQRAAVRKAGLEALEAYRKRRREADPGDAVERETRAPENP
jgi:hypothetical protein